MEPEGSIPCSQEPSTGPYPESYPTNPLHSIPSYLSKIHFIQIKYILTFYGLKCIKILCFKSIFLTVFLGGKKKKKLWVIKEYFVNTFRYISITKQYSRGPSNSRSVFSLWQRASPFSLRFHIHSSFQVQSYHVSFVRAVSRYPLRWVSTFSTGHWQLSHISTAGGYVPYYNASPKFWFYGKWNVVQANSYGLRYVCINLEV
jgi:hypothetical protein